MSEVSRVRSPEERRLLELAAQCLPGGVLGSSRFPDELAFVVPRGRGSPRWDAGGRACPAPPASPTSWRSSSGAAAAPASGT